MKSLHQGAQNLSRIIILLFLLVVVGLGLYLLFAKLFGSSPLQKLSATEARWAITLQKPAVLAKALGDKDILPDAALNELLPALLPGATREQLMATVQRLPEQTVMVGYANSGLAAFGGSKEQCDTFRQGALQATMRDGLCVLHTTQLDEARFDTSKGSVWSVYGAQLPDNPAGVRMLLTQNFPFSDAVTAAWGGVMTPQALVARSFMGKQFPVAMTLDETSAGDLRLQGHVLMDSAHPVPESVQKTFLHQSALQGASAQGAFVALPLRKGLTQELTKWMEEMFGKDTVRAANHFALEVTEPLTPVGIQDDAMPEASMLISWDPKNITETWSMELTDLDKQDTTLVEKAVQDALTFQYGISETPTTLPDKTRGVLVTASMENIQTEVETMSGVTMTTYISKDTPRVVTSAEERSFRIGLPGTMSGAVLRAPKGETSSAPWMLPIDPTQQVVLRLPVGERQVYAGFVLLRDRLRFDIVLTSRS